MKTTKKITLDLYTKNVVSVSAKQYDTDTRFIEITCVDEGVIFNIDKSTMSAYLRFKKPDNNGVFNEVEITDEAKLRVTLTEQMLATPGRAIADIFLLKKVYTSNEKPTNVEDIYNIKAPIISVMDFYVNITPTALNHSEIESSYEFSALENALAQIDYNNKKVEVLDKTLTDNENQRIENENIRKENETNRVSAENKRQTDTVDAIKKANEATSKTNAAIDKANDFIFRADGALNTINQKAQEVQTNANNAKASETNSATSENNAKTYMKNASTSAITASSKADEALASANSASASENTINIKVVEINQKVNDVESIKSDIQNIASDVSDMRDAVAEDKTTIEDTIKNSLLASSEEIFAAIKDYYDRAQELYNSMYIDCDGETPQQRVVTIVSIDCGTPQSRLHDINGILFNGGTPLNRQLAS